MAPGRKLPVIFSVESDKPAIIRASNCRKRKIGRWYKVQNLLIAQWNGYVIIAQKKIRFI